MLSNKILVAILLFFSFLLPFTITVPSPNDEFDTIRQQVLELII
jgi:hypothetical protein